MESKKFNEFMRNKKIPEEKKWRYCAEYGKNQCIMVDNDVFCLTGTRTSRIYLFARNEKEEDVRQSKQFNSMAQDE